MSTKQQWLYWGPVAVMLSLIAVVMFHLQLWAFAVLYRLALYFHYLP